ncbi:MAG: peptidyl-prolyl cis-trans isomerase, partial [PS1 clade bacterium]|nr:peptidyl-prolyl cis-trans isomerase [PS1 clade bacterium]
MALRLLRRLFQALVRDRFVWFIVIGLALFGLDKWRTAQDDHLIIVDLPLLEKLAAQWQGQTDRMPDATELDALVEGYVREEILVREARRLELHQNDVIIRRRLAQKVEFFLTNPDAGLAPDTAMLRAFYTENREAYRQPETFSFNHVFVGDEKTASDTAARLNIDETGWRALGRPFMLKRSYRAVTAEKLAAEMGDDFVAALRAAPGAKWSAPIASAFGVHAVKLLSHEKGGDRPFDAVAEYVARDWRQLQQEK